MLLSIRLEKAAQLQKLARVLKFVHSNYRDYTVSAANNKGADQTAWLHRLICFVMTRLI